jgi:hypothetical protein
MPCQDNTPGSKVSDPAVRETLNQWTEFRFDYTPFEDVDVYHQVQIEADSVTNHANGAWFAMYKVGGVFVRYFGPSVYAYWNLPAVNYSMIAFGSLEGTKPFWPHGGEPWIGYWPGGESPPTQIIFDMRRGESVSQMSVPAIVATQANVEVVLDGGDKVWQVQSKTTHFVSDIYFEWTDAITLDADSIDAVWYSETLLRAEAAVQASDEAIVAVLPDASGLAVGTDTSVQLVWSENLVLDGPGEPHRYYRIRYWGSYAALSYGVILAP